MTEGIHKSTVLNCSAEVTWLTQQNTRDIKGWVMPLSEFESLPDQAHVETSWHTVIFGFNIRAVLWLFAFHGLFCVFENRNQKNITASADIPPTGSVCDTQVCLMVRPNNRTLLWASIRNRRDKRMAVIVSVASCWNIWIKFTWQNE